MVNFNLKLKFLTLLTILSIFLAGVPKLISYSLAESDSFLQCFSSHLNDTALSSIISAPKEGRTPSFQQEFIVKPVHESQAQTAVICAKRSGLRSIVEDGRLSYALLGFNYTVPFVTVYLDSLQSITVDIRKGHVWLEAGACIDHLMFILARGQNCTVSLSYDDFEGRFGCSRIGSYGLDGYNVIGARVLDLRTGAIMNIESSVGGKVFRRIIAGREGSGFGAILSWKLKLQPELDRNVCKLISFFLDQLQRNTFSDMDVSSVVPNEIKCKRKLKWA